MAVFDTITFLEDHELVNVRTGDSYQAKNLVPGNTMYVVKGGRLWLQQVGSQVVEPYIEFHGDLLLRGKAQLGLYELVVRFTESKLEWIRQPESCSEVLMERLRSAY